MLHVAEIVVPHGYFEPESMEVTLAARPLTTSAPSSNSDPLRKHNSPLLSSGYLQHTSALEMEQDDPSSRTPNLELLGHHPSAHGI